jgi:PAS domain S-box-containing protein
MSQGVIYQGRDGKIISCNPAAERILGLKSDQMQGRTSSDPRWRAIHEDGTDFKENDHPSILSLKSGKKVENIIMGVLNQKNNKYTWINVNSVPQFRNGEKKPYQVYTTFEDITQIKVAEKELAKSEERYRLAQKAAEIGSWDYNIETGDLAWSDQIEPMFGFKKNTFGKTYEAFLDCIHPDDKNIVIDSISNCIEKNVKQDIEHRIIWPDGSIHWVKEIGNLIRDRDGKPIRMIGVVQEITERKKNEEQIKKLNSNLLRHATELTSINKELEAFSYSVSHDLRAPLRSIDGFSHALFEDYYNKLDDEGKDYIIRIRKATNRMSDIINDLLKLSQITRHSFEHERVNLSELSFSIISELQKENPNRRVKIELDDDLFVSGDKHLLYLALENLIGNSWKFTRKNPKAEIKIGKIIKNGKKVFFIKDNGVGFDMNYADKLFLPFQRLHSNDEFPGIGIGLGIVSRIINRHGGKIWAESKIGKGANFYFTIRENEI